MIKPFYLFGLGNPGKKYTGTRHNAGHLLVSFLEKEKIEGLRFLKNERVGMNEVGKEVAEIVKQKNISLDKLIVVHDDMDIPLGQFRLQKNRGSAGHRGIDSVVSSLRSQDFWRLRIGIGRPGDVGCAKDYVLGKLSKKELSAMRAIVPLVVKKLRLMTSGQ